MKDFRNNMKDGSDGVKPVLEMLNEITANGARQECRRQSLLNTMSPWALDLNINRMVKDELVEEVTDEERVYYRIPNALFKCLYRSKHDA